MAVQSHEELEELRKHFGTWDALATIVSQRKGFETVSRQTFSMWSKSEKVTEKEAGAIRILSQQRKNAQLTIACNPSLWTLPVMLAVSDSMQGRFRPFSLLNYGIQVELIRVASGGEAMSLLELGRADIAIAGTDLFKEQKKCKRLCTIANAGLVGVVKTQPPRRIPPIFKFHGKKIGYLRTSAAGFALQRRLRETSVKVDLIPFNSIDEIADKLVTDIDGIVGWQPGLNSIVEKVKTLAPDICFAAVDGDIGRVKIALGVNMETSPNPRAVRRLLTCIAYASRELNRLTKPDCSDHELSKQIKDLFIPDLKVSDHDIVETFEACTFGLSSLPPDLTLRLWASEVHETFEA